MVAGLDVVGGMPKWKRPKPLPTGDPLIPLRKRVARECVSVLGILCQPNILFEK